MSAVCFFNWIKVYDFYTTFNFSGIVLNLRPNVLSYAEVGY